MNEFWDGVDQKASSAGGMGTLERKLLHVKQSIDHVLNILKRTPIRIPIGVRWLIQGVRSSLLLKTQLGV